jgi:addiction module HigA family antidote
VNRGPIEHAQPVGEHVGLKLRIGRRDALFCALPRFGRRPLRRADADLADQYRLAVVLREEFLEPMGVSVYALAKAIHVTRSRINEIYLGRQAITTNIALRLGRFFGVDPQWFMNMQAKYDLHVQAQKLRDELARIAPRSAA